MKRIVDALARDRDALGSQTVLQLSQRNIRLACHHLVQPILMLGQLPFLLAAHLARRIAARLTPSADKRYCARRTHTKPTRRRPGRTPRLHRLDNPFAKIKRMTIPHIVPPITQDTRSWGRRESTNPIRVNPELL
jgi:hypothetical protein